MVTETPAPKQPPSRPQPLRIVRRNRLLSQRDLAEKAGITSSTIYLIETARTLPQLRVMRRICDALGVSYTEVEEFVQSMAEGPR